MKNKIKNLLTLLAFIVFSIIAVSSSDENTNNSEQTEQESMDFIETNDSPSDNYEYTESNNQFAEGWKIYHAYQPSYEISADCDSRTCEYCGEEYYAKEIEYIEIPNTSNAFQMLNIVQNNNESNQGDLGLMLGGIGDLSIDDDLIDYDNKTITTKWEYKCVFNDLNFCSKKCKNLNNYN